jgi:hypothetical protein
MGVRVRARSHLHFSMIPAHCGLTPLPVEFNANTKTWARAVVAGLFTGAGIMFSGVIWFALLGAASVPVPGR